MLAEGVGGVYLGVWGYARACWSYSATFVESGLGAFGWRRLWRGWRPTGGWWLVAVSWAWAMEALWEQSRHR